MKTYSQFKEHLHEAVPALLAAPLALPALTFAAGAAANYAKGVFAAKKQGEGRRSQPVDYGQGGTAKPRTPNVQRPSGKLSSAEVQRRQALDDRRAQAAERARERAERGIDELIGSDAERRAAAQARANQPQIQRDLRRKAMRDRMEKAARERGLD